MAVLVIRLLQVSPLCGNLAAARGEQRLGRHRHQRLRAGRGRTRALALMPLRTEKRNVGQRDVPVQLQGVWVRPGDWLLAGADGVVVMAHPPGAEA